MGYEKQSFFFSPATKRLPFSIRQILLVLGGAVLPFAEPALNALEMLVEDLGVGDMLQSCGEHRFRDVKDG